MLLLTAQHQILLMQVEPAPGRRVWIAPGGGLEDDESEREAAAREVLEETGRAIAPGPKVWTRAHEFDFLGRRIDQRESYFLARTARFEPSPDGLEAIEREAFRAFRWWGFDEIRASDAVFAPRRLGELLVRLEREGPPAQPIDCGA